jgi:ATP-dependent Clp protease ATP-binding subunit ClpA
LRLKEKGIEFIYTDDALKFICKNEKTRGGARHIRRRIARLCERPISEKILSGEAGKGSKIKIYSNVKADGLIIEVI